jgi:hypothetical protein
MEPYNSDSDKLINRCKTYINNYCGGSFKVFTVFERYGEIYVQLSLKNDAVEVNVGTIATLEYFTQNNSVLFNKDGFEIFNASENEMESVVRCVEEYLLEN